MNWQVFLNGRRLPPEYWEWREGEIRLRDLNLDPGVEIRSHVDWARALVDIIVPHDAIRALERSLDLKS